MGFAAALPHPRSHVMRWLRGFGAPGLFAVSVVDASPIPLPFPGSTDLLLLVLVAHGSIPWLMTLAASSGSLLGGYLTWRAGEKGGEVAIKRHVSSRYTARLSGWVEDHGMLAVAIASVLPPPVPLTPFLLAAGALGVERRKFLVSFGVARSVRYGLVAWLGATYGRAVVREWSRYLADWGTTITWATIALFAGAILFGVWRFRVQRWQAVRKDRMLAGS